MSLLLVAEVWCHFLELERSLVTAWSQKLLCHCLELGMFYVTAWRKWSYVTAWSSKGFLSLLEILKVLFHCFEQKISFVTD